MTMTTSITQQHSSQRLFNRPQSGLARLISRLQDFSEFAQFRQPAIGQAAEMTVMQIVNGPVE
jgi:hypothetical protein